MNLEWDGTHLDAKAIHEWADDGTFDIRLAWHDRLRLTFVTDALGNTTQQYYDIDGLDVGKLCSCGLQATHDKPNGHVTIRPINDPTDSKLTDWAKSTGGGSTHSLTEGILGAVTGRGKK